MRAEDHSLYREATNASGPEFGERRSALVRFRARSLPVPTRKREHTPAKTADGCA